MTLARLAMLAVLGIASQLLAILIWLGIKSATGFDVANFWVNLIVPVGALLLGFVAGIGFGMARHIDAPAGPAMLATMILFSAGGAAFMQFASYWLAEVDGLAARDVLGFFEYLQIINANAAMRMGSHENASVLELGRLGYVLTLAEIAAYVAASLWVYLGVRTPPYCEPCARYLRDAGVVRLQFPDIASYVAYIRSLPEDGQTRMRAHQDWRSDYYPRGSERGMTTLAATLSACPACAHRHLAERVTHVGAEGPGPIADFARDFDWIEHELRPSTLPVQPMASAMPRSFGRRSS